MTTVQREKIALRKLSLLQLAQELGNIKKACHIIGYSRQQFYEIRRNYQVYGAGGLVDRLPGAKGPHPNRVRPEIEAAVLEHALEQARDERPDPLAGVPRGDPQEDKERSQETLN